MGKVCSAELEKQRGTKVGDLLTAGGSRRSLSPVCAQEAFGKQLDVRSKVSGFDCALLQLKYKEHRSCPALDVVGFSVFT